jgi:hypothetical protein
VKSVMSAFKNVKCSLLALELGFKIQGEPP